MFYLFCTFAYEKYREVPKYEHNRVRSEIIGIYPTWLLIFKSWGQRKVKGQTTLDVGRCVSAQYVENPMLDKTQTLYMFEEVDVVDF